MPRFNKTLFVSDIHLSESQPKQTALFLKFLTEIATQSDALYILGDLFDVWVGEDIHTHFQNQILTAFQNLRQLIPIYFINGNRDFLCNPKWLAKAGIQKLPDPYLISLYGIPTVLTHGDTLCTLDKAYQRYRRIAQNPLTRFIFLNLPKSLRHKISLKLRRKSQQYQEGQQNFILDVTQDAVIKLFDQYKAKQIIHGHVHRPNFHEHIWQNTTLSRLVLGDWHKKGYYLSCTPEDQKLISFDDACQSIEAVTTRTTQINKI